MFLLMAVVLPPYVLDRLFDSFSDEAYRKLKNRRLSEHQSNDGNMNGFARYSNEEAERDPIAGNAEDEMETVLAILDIWLLIYNKTYISWLIVMVDYSSFRK